MTRNIRSVALINFLGDFGISQYTYELAEGLAANGVRVDVYASGGSRREDLELPRHHRYLPVIGSLLQRQRALLDQSGDALLRRAASPPVVATENVPDPVPMHRYPALARHAILMAELAWHLKRSGYDLVWTQWPLMITWGGWFWRIGKALGLRMAHTVHNVLPHDARSGDVGRCASLYRACDILFVHSAMALREMEGTFPDVVGKTRVMNLGLYTLYPRRPDTRADTRKQLDLEPDQVAVLAFGGVRPYKNIDTVLAGFAAAADRRAVLVVAGQESGYPDTVPGDPLGRTRRLAQRLGIADRVRLLPRGIGFEETAELFEAVDALILAYAKSYGSGALLLGMTFGKFIIASRTGGMDEYLHHYPTHEIVETVETEAVADAIARAVDRVAAGDTVSSPRRPALEWRNIARSALALLSESP